MGRALENQNEVKKAISVYRELISLGVPISGLKEKLSELENLYEEQLKKEIRKEATMQVQKPAQKPEPIVPQSNVLAFELLPEAKATVEE